MQPNLLRTQIDVTFHEGRGEWGTVISMLQVLISGCLGRDFVGKQSRNMPPETRKLITFANCSNPSSSFVIIKLLIPDHSLFHTGHQTTIMYSSRLLHSMVLTHLGLNDWVATYVNEFIAWMLPTSKSCF